MAIRVLIVDDSPFARQTLKKMINSHPGMEVVGIARNGEEAISKVYELSPDVVTLDLEMPKMDGFTVIRILMKSHPLPIIVVSSRSSSSDVFKALELGAVDFVAKPTSRASEALYSIGKEMVEKILIASRVDIKRKLKEHADLEAKVKEGEALIPRVKEVRVVEEGIAPSRVVVIGASTGGPTAIFKILSALKPGLDVAIFVAQHMPEGFTQAFAERLDKYSPYRVSEGTKNESVIKERVYVAPGGYHMVLDKDAIGRPYIKLLKRSEKDKYVPSIDELFKSAAQVYGSRTIGVILTGMGSDGVEGLRAIKEAGGVTVAESEETSVLFGMPKEAIEKKVAQYVLPLPRIPVLINRLLLKE